MTGDGDAARLVPVFVLPVAAPHVRGGYAACQAPPTPIVNRFAPSGMGILGIDVCPADTLAPLAAHFRDYRPIEPYTTVVDLDAGPPVYAADFQDIEG
jgi:hypothetical protein